MIRGRNSGQQCCRPPKRGLFSIITVLGVVVAISFLACFSFGSNSKAEPSLRYLSILHRHGERTPRKHTYPLDPYSNDSFWPEGRGELMKKGTKTLFEAGKFLRRRYDGFIPSKYKASELLVLSSYIDRCIMSGQALLAGLYPPVDDQIWNPEVQWQPIPVHPIPSILDNMFTGHKPCKKFEKEKESVRDAILKKIQAENQDLIDYVYKNAGVVVKSIIDLEDLYDALLIAVFIPESTLKLLVAIVCKSLILIPCEVTAEKTNEQGFKLPEWAWNVFPEKLKLMARYSLTGFSWTPTMKRLYSGVLINDIVTNMKKKRDSKDAFKRLLNLYSGHDITLINFLISISVDQEMPLPGYGSQIIIELHEINSKYRVKILYLHNGWDKNVTVLHVKGCKQDEDIYHDDMCDLDVFASALNEVRVTDFEKECEESSDTL